MKPPPFWYHRPASPAEVDNLLHSLPGRVSLLAGGQSLVPAMARREVRPDHVIDLGGMPSEPLFADGAALTFGPLTRLSALEGAVARLPVLAEILPLVACRPVRNRATLIGNVMCAEPAAELPALALLLGATVRLRGAAAADDVPIATVLCWVHSKTFPAGTWVDQLTLPLPRTSLAFCETSSRHAGAAVAGAIACGADLVLFGPVGGPVLHPAVSDVAGLPIRADGYQREALLGLARRCIDRLSS